MSANFRKKSTEHSIDEVQDDTVDPLLQKSSRIQSNSNLDVNNANNATPCSCFKNSSITRSTIIGACLLLLLYFIPPLLFLIFGKTMLGFATYLRLISFSKHNADHCSAKKYFTTYDNFTITNVDIPIIGGSNKDLLASWYIKTNLNSQNKLIIYSHGNAYDRCNHYRIQGYKQVSKLGYDIIAFDYIGYSNSSGPINGQPYNDNSLILSLRSVFNFVNSTPEFNTYKKKILWGHSLGTAVTSATIGNFQNYLENLDGLVLEASFDSYNKMILGGMPVANIVAKIYGKLFTETVTKVSKKYNIGYSFETANNLLKINSKIAKNFKIKMFQSETDGILPISGSDRLYEKIKSHFNVKNKNLEYVRIDKSRKFAHNDIMRYGVEYYEDILNSL